MKIVPLLKEAVLAYGHFNSVHPGHIRYLKNASSQRQISYLLQFFLIQIKELIENINFHRWRRAEGLASMNIVDGILLLEDEEYSLVNAINALKPAS